MASRKKSDPAAGGDQGLPEGSDGTAELHDLDQFPGADAVGEEPAAAAEDEAPPALESHDRAAASAPAPAGPLDVEPVEAAAHHEPGSRSKDPRSSDADVAEAASAAAMQSPHRAAISYTTRETAGRSVTATTPASSAGGRRWLDRTTVGVAVLVVLAVVCAGLIIAVVLKTRNDAGLAAREAAAYTPPPLFSATPIPTGPIVAVISDESATRAADGVDAEERWPQVLADDLEAALVTSGSAGAGYATNGASGSTFAKLAEQVPSDAQAVVFVGGASDDRISTLSLARAATQAFSAAAERAPEAAIIVIGPLYRPATVSTEDMTTLRTTLRSATQVADVQWVDPIRSGWLDGVDSTGDLSVVAERAVAARMRAVIGAATS